MIAAYNRMLAETRALFAAPPAGLAAEADTQEPQEPPPPTPPPEATSVCAAVARRCIATPQPWPVGNRRLLARQTITCLALSRWRYA